MQYLTYPFLYLHNIVATLVQHLPTTFLATENQHRVHDRSQSPHVTRVTRLPVRPQLAWQPGVQQGLKPVGPSTPTSMRSNTHLVRYYQCHEMSGPRINVICMSVTQIQHHIQCLIPKVLLQVTNYRSMVIELGETKLPSSSVAT